MSAKTFKHLEAQLRQDARVFTQAPPAHFRSTLGRQLRRLQPPAPPKPERFRWLTARNTLIAAAAGIALVFGLSLIEPPTDPVGLATAMTSAGETVTAIPQTASALTTSTYEMEWDNLKADADTLATPFRSVVPAKALFGF